MFATEDIMTPDGLTLFFAATHLSRYHLTQLLLLKLLQSDRPRVVMLTATLKSVPKLNPTLFPYFEGFNFLKHVAQINGACLYYADYLTKTPQDLRGLRDSGVCSNRHLPQRALVYPGLRHTGWSLPGLQPRNRSV
jgi:hypothetical protein